MRRLILILALVIVLSLCIPGIIKGNSFPPVLAIVVFLIIVSCYLEGVRFSLWFSGVAGMVILYLLLKGGDFRVCLGAWVTFGTSPLLAGRLKEKLDRQKENVEKTLSEKTRTYDRLLDEFVAISTRNTQLEEEASGIASLYEITREMSANLEFAELFEIFSRTMRQRFNFVRCRFVLLKEDVKEEPDVEEIWDIKKEEPSAEGGPPAESPPAAAEPLTPVESEILREMVADKKHFSAPARHLAGGDRQDKRDGYTSIPLVVKDVLLGALIVEGLPEGESEMLAILAQQFSLEIKKAKLYKTMQELSITDGLTQLYLRRHFLERLNEEIRRSERHSLKLSFLMVDLDHFKECNDHYGHLVGDVVLREVSRLLKSNIREIDLIGRYGGEEFSILLPETSRESTYQVAERLRSAIAGGTVRAYDENISITISIGGAVFPDQAQDTSALIEIADKALYRAKQSGRNRTVI